jgi:hypothetical protein
VATGRLPDPNTAPVTAKGDLYTYSTVPAKLAVGNNGETLVADSSTSTGLRYTAGNAVGNPVLNSAMQIWQRGTSITTASATYTADRWYASAASAGTVSRQTTSDTTNLPSIQYALRFQRTNGSTSTTDLGLTQSFETVNSIPYAGKTISFSFYARAGANYSATSSALGARVWSGTGTDQNLGVGYTGGAIALNNTATLTTTWQRFTYTGTIPTTATEIGIQFFGTPTGTAGANDWYEITGVQIDLGSVALPFRTYSATLAGELAACQRYYWRNSGDNYNPMGPSGYVTASTTANAYMVLPVEMRVKTASVDFSNIALRDVAGSGYTISAITASVISTTKVVRLDCTISGATSGRWGFIEISGTSAGYLGLSAEL